VIYFFERNVSVYLKGFTKKIKDKSHDEGNTNKKDKKKYCPFAEEGEHLTILKDCIDFLCKFNNGTIKGKNIYITLLYCISYIKCFCYIFIKLNKEKKIKPDNIIKIINESELNMIKIYIYKIIYNKNHKQFNVFIDNWNQQNHRLYHAYCHYF